VGSRRDVATPGIEAGPTSRPLARHEFIRAHALGNDYLVVDGAAFGLALTPARIRRLCDRHVGVGSDGILEAVLPPAGFDAALRILNPDGSEAEKSGNGVRIFAKFCLDHRRADASRPLRLHTSGGAVEARLVRREADRSVLRVSLGRASFRMRDLPMRPPPGGSDEGEWVAAPLDAGDRRFTVTCLSVGNPHCVVLDAPFDEATCRRYGPLIETHPRFPRRTNVQLARVRDRRTVEALIWERGAGFTLASGSSSCAVAAACVRAGLCDREVEVVMPGGSLHVLVHEDWSLEQTGPAQEIARGTLAPDLVAALERE
jgi:diaminopimelate epimerase